MLRPTRPTLFPYTTLFRSLGHEVDVRRQVLVLERRRRRVHDDVVRRAAREAVLGTGPVPRTASRDRKSTRLNSSHPSISYAVFCLKKNIEPKSRHILSLK